MNANDIDDCIVENVESDLGMGHGAWDMVDPKQLIASVLAVCGADNAVQKLENAAIFIVRLARALPAEHLVRTAAIDWLCRNNLLPSVLRDIPPKIDVEEMK